MRSFVAWSFVSSFLGSVAWSGVKAPPPFATGREAEINARLSEFEAYPARTMALPPIRRTIQRGSGLEPPFSRREITNRSFVTRKDDARSHINLLYRGQPLRLESTSPAMNPLARGAGAENLVDIPSAQMLRTLESIEDSGLTQASLDESPWSDSYWPLSRGEVASRYYDATFNAFPRGNWKRAYDYAHTPPRDFASIFQSLNSGLWPSYPVDLLSPAEKYDLLVGDSAGTLTRAMWADGAAFANQNGGQVETWMGICHGWSSAALMEFRPSSTVKTVAADGSTPITFYPSDIKALSAVLWANTGAPSRFVGGRCNDKNPARDENGRIISPQCYDTNPGVWHLSVVNQIGEARRGFIMDATYDYEVWNQPVYGYRYSYFNPQRERTVRRLADARVPMAEFTRDKFRRYRAPEAASVVGIAMDVTYVMETVPTHNATDDSSQDAMKTVTYLYDLELDAQGRIIGGEWWGNSSPDFLWVHPIGTRATTAADRFLSGSWDIWDPLPDSWRSAALQASRARLPLEAIVQALINATRR